jgi:hypothetical protein
MTYKMQFIVNIFMVKLLTTFYKLRSNINVHMLQGRKRKCSWDLREGAMLMKMKKFAKKKSLAFN